MRLTDNREKVNPVYDPRTSDPLSEECGQTVKQTHAREYIKWGNVKGIPVRSKGGRS